MLAVELLPPIVKHLDSLLCCCANNDCIAQQHNRQIMQQLERELRTAAEIGQHLLTRHDEYVREAEAERTYFLREIDRQASFAKLVDELESTNRDLEEQNQRTMRENLMLLKKLEDINVFLNTADSRNHELRISLTEAEKEVGNLSYKATKAKALETQVLTVELEREELTRDLTVLTRTNQQNSLRYTQAERQIAELQKQLDAIENTHLLDLELDMISHTKSEHQPSGLMDEKKAPVAQDLSFIVADLIASKTTLESGNEELREILAHNQEEIASLREQLLSYQRPPSLGERNSVSLGPRKTVSQELHEHHHYHYHVPVKKHSRITGINSTANKSETHQQHVTIETSSSPELSTLPAKQRQKRSSYDSSTPVRGRMQHIGIMSPPSTQKTKRDSGYFSFSDAGRDRSSTLSYPSSPLPMMSDEAPSPSLPGRIRSNSHESVFIPQSSLATPDVHVNAELVRRVTLREALPSKISQEVPDLQALPTTTRLRHASSHESILKTDQASQAQIMLSRFNTPKRPFPSPLQNSTPSAVVALTSATALSRGDTSTSGARVNSYTTLRNAAAQQSRLSPTIIGPGQSPGSLFWKQGSTERASVTPIEHRPSRWKSFVRWQKTEEPSVATGSSSPEPAPGGTTTYSARGEPSIHEYKAGVNHATLAAPSATLTAVEEDMLRDALG